MRKIVYMCDECGEAFGAKPHISINLANQSGIATPSDFDADIWTTVRVASGIKQFCNGKCLGKFFQKTLTEVRKNPVAPF